jgi:hypothetical protein
MADSSSSSSSDNVDKLKAKLAKLEAKKKAKKEKKKQEKEAAAAAAKAALGRSTMPPKSASASTSTGATAPKAAGDLRVEAKDSQVIPSRPPAAAPAAATTATFVPDADMLERAKKLVSKDGNIFLYALTHGLATDRYNNVLNYFEQIYTTGRTKLKLDETQQLLLKAIVRLIIPALGKEQELVAAERTSDLITAAGGLLDRKLFKVHGANSIMSFALKTIWPVWFVPPELLLADKQGKIDSAFLTKRKGSKTDDQVINFETAIPYLLKLAHASDEELDEAARNSVLPTDLFGKFWKIIRAVRIDLENGVPYVAQDYERAGYVPPSTSAVAEAGKAEIAALKASYKAKKAAFDAAKEDATKKKEAHTLKSELAAIKVKIDALKDASEGGGLVATPNVPVMPKLLPAPWEMGIGIGDWAFCTSGNSHTVPPNLSIWANRETFRFIGHCSTAHTEITKPPKSKKQGSKVVSPSLVSDSKALVSTSTNVAKDQTLPYITKMLESYSGNIQTDGRDFARALGFTPDMMQGAARGHFMTFGEAHSYFLAVAYPLRWFLHNVHEAEKRLAEDASSKLSTFDPTVPSTIQEPPMTAIPAQGEDDEEEEEEEEEDDGLNAKEEEEEEPVDRMDLDPPPPEAKQPTAPAAPSGSTEEKEKKEDKDREEHKRRKAERQKKREEKERRRKEKEQKKSGGQVASSPNKADAATEGGGQKRSKEMADLSSASVEKPAAKKAKKEAVAAVAPPAPDAMDLEKPASKTTAPPAAVEKPSAVVVVEQQPQTLVEFMPKLGSTRLEDVVSSQDADAFRAAMEEADRLTALVPVHHFDPAYVTNNNMPDEQALIELLDTLKAKSGKVGEVRSASLMRAVMLTMTAGSLVQQITSSIRDTPGAIEEVYDSTLIDYLNEPKNLDDLAIKFAILHGSQEVVKQVFGLPQGRSLTALVH